mgnify:FL=1
MKRMFLVLLFFIIFLEVDAASYNGKLYEVHHPNSGFTIFADEGLNLMDYNSWMIKSSVDNRVYYCIEPETKLDGASKGSHSMITGDKNIINNSKLTTSKFEKIKLIAYYGYGYKDNNVDHTAKKWYGITQVMIWRIMRPDLTWTFKSSRNASPNKSLYSKEVAEINKLVKEHLAKPSFASKKYKIKLGESIDINDTNKVLSNYNLVSSSKNIKVTRNGNKLKITAIKIGSDKLTYKKSSRTSESFALFASSNYQDIISVGNPSIPSFSFDVEVTGGTVRLNKIDSLNNSFEAQGDAKLAGAIYEVFDLNGKSVGKITINDKGFGELFLDYGSYKIKEVKAPVGYKKNDKVYDVVIDKNHLNVDIDVSDEVINGKIIIKKKKGGTGEELVSESNACFEIKDSSSNFVSKMCTNTDGVAFATLPYGKYSISQISGADGYNFVKDFNVNVALEKEYVYELENLRPSKVIFTKVDKSLDLKLSDAFIEVYDYNDKMVFSGKTDDDGMLIFDNVKIGKYYLIEKVAPKYYKLSLDKVYFDVDSDGKVIDVEISNERKKGKLLFIKTDGSGLKRLSNAYFKIYFKDFDKLVYDGKTDNDGMIRLDNLDAGTYCIYESLAPSGYKLDDKPNCFEIKDENEVIKINMTNNMLVKVPDTGEVSFSFIVKVCLIFFTVSLCVVIYYVKKY